MKVPKIPANMIGSSLLLLGTLVALVASNTSLQGIYHAWLAMPFTIGIGPLSLREPLLLWVNDALMVLFFLSVGLELKREFCSGQLASREHRVLPVAAAIGGMVVPALLFFLINRGQSTLAGWAIPVATDIAFAWGVLSLFGKRVPSALKLFLLTLAIVDDLGAIIIIAFGYTDDIAWTWLAFAVVATVLLVVMNRCRVTLLTPYCVLGVVLWVCVLHSGVHATVAGVVLAFTIPLGLTLHRLEKILLPWVSFVIVPVFALANAGLSFEGVTWHMLLSPLTAGIIVGLLIGKPVGVGLVSALLIKLRLARLPGSCSWGAFYGVSMLCGIGFTMSLFIGTLAFTQTDANVLQHVRLGVFAGSVLSAIVGCVVLFISLRKDCS